VCNTYRLEPDIGTRSVGTRKLMGYNGVAMAGWWLVLGCGVIGGGSKHPGIV